MTVFEAMTDIANAIRAKTGGTQKLNLLQMAEAIPQVYDRGQQAENNAFWDAIQRNGTRSDYQYAFLQWDAEQILPKYVIKAPSIYATFTQNNLLKHVDERTLELSGGVKNMYSAFAWCPALEEVDVHIRLTENTDAVGMMATFNGCPALKRVKKITSAAHVQYANTFSQCAALESITFAGVIGNHISFGDSPLLSKDSIVSVINALSDSASGQSVTFSKRAVDNAFYEENGEGAIGSESLEWQLLIAQKANWTITLV